MPAGHGIGKVRWWAGERGWVRIWQARKVLEGLVCTAHTFLRINYSTALGLMLFLVCMGFLPHISTSTWTLASISILLTMDLQC